MAPSSGSGTGTGGPGTPRPASGSWWWGRARSPRSSWHARRRRGRSLPCAAAPAGVRTGSPPPVLRRYLRWLAGRSAAAALHRMRSGAEDIAREELARVAGELPAEVRSSMERVLLKTVHRLVHKPTLELRAAVEADDSDLVSVLAGLFDAAPSPGGRTADGAGLLAADPDTTAGARRPALDVQR